VNAKTAEYEKKHDCMSEERARQGKISHHPIKEREFFGIGCDFGPTDPQRNPDMVEYDGQGGKASQGIDDAESFHGAFVLPRSFFSRNLSQSKETPIGTTNPIMKEPMTAADQGTPLDSSLAKLFCCKEKWSTRMNKLRFPMKDKVLAGHWRGV
jgi:hypothetical protein